MKKQSKKVTSDDELKTALRREIKVNAEKAAQREMLFSADAMHYTQAAVNAANALQALFGIGC